MTSIDTPSPRRCRGTTVRGQPCRAWAVKGDNYCVMHKSQEGARPGGRHRDPPPRALLTIDDLIDAMFQKLSVLSAMIDQAEDTDEYLRLVAVYSRNTTHLARLFRERRLLPAAPSDDLMTLLGQALDELSEELDINL